ncbi:MAG: hypothetical protein PHV82_01365 [Victivallaceae bacterium]|nr:hypothetical protein [Victivallaceae bacterium]
MNKTFKKKKRKQQKATSFNWYFPKDISKSGNAVSILTLSE